MAAQVQFLMDPSDSLLAYEIGGMTEPFCQNLLMTATSTMSRVQQLEFIYGETTSGTVTSAHLTPTNTAVCSVGYNELMTSINEFLHHCAAEGKVGNLRPHRIDSRDPFQKSVHPELRKTRQN